MGEESYMSGASGMSGMDAPAAAGATGGAMAPEMITKKLANYWILIGCIPLLLFLLVAVPTVLYVKSVSDYVNAYYCNTDSCKAEGSRILSLQSGGPKPCDDFYDHVCPSSMQGLERLSLKYLASKMKSSLVKGKRAVTDNFMLLHQVCVGTTDPSAALAQIRLDPLFFNGWPNWAIADPDPATAAGRATKYYAIDSFVTAKVVWSAVYPAGSTKASTMDATLELSMPRNTYVEFLKNNVNSKGKNVVTGFDVFWKAVLQAAASPLSDEQSNLIFGRLVNFQSMFAEYAYTKAASPRHPVLTTVDKMKKLSNKFWLWDKYFAVFGATLTANKVIRVMDPSYILGLAAFFKNLIDRRQMTDSALTVQVGMDIYLGVFGPTGFPNPKDWKLYERVEGCLIHVDQLMPHAIALGLGDVYQKQFAAITLRKPDGKGSMPLHVFGIEKVRAVAEEMDMSHSLSMSSTEASRVRFYEQVKDLTVMAFYANDTDKPTDKVAQALYGGVTVTEDSTAFSTYQPIVHQRMNKYWSCLAKVDPANAGFLMFRDGAPGLMFKVMYFSELNTLYVPLSVLVPKMYKDSGWNKLSSAKYGYYITKGLMQMFTPKGSLIKPMQLYSEPWLGSSTTGLLQTRLVDCLQAARGNKTNLMHLNDPINAGAITPAFRYYRKMARKRAYPRPEYRLDDAPYISETAIFFYVWSQPYCHTPGGKDMMNMAVKHDDYFHEAFDCKAGDKMFLPPQKRCYIWRSTRLNY